MAIAKDITIEQGKTLIQIVRWETTPIVYKAISNITQAAPAVISSTAHGVPDGWRVAIVSAKGMTQINASNPPKEAEYKTATVNSADVIELNEVNSSDFKAYVSGGYVQYNTPVDLAGCSVRMKIKDKVGGTVLASTELADTGVNMITATLDNVKKTITIKIGATNTAALTWKKGVYEIEAEDGDGVVTALMTGSVTVTKEVAA